MGEDAAEIQSGKTLQFAHGGKIKDLGHVILFGSLSGIAEKIAEGFLAKGYSIVLCARNREALERQAADLRIRFKGEVVTEVWDAAHLEGQHAVFARCTAGRTVSGVVFAAGVMHEQEASEPDWRRIAENYSINLAAPAVMLGLWAPYFAAQGKGFISCLSSVAGDRGRPSNFLYGSSKAGLSAYLEGLRAKYARKGVLVQTVKPGMVRTAMTAGLPASPLFADPEKVAQDIVRGILRGKEVLYTPSYWRLIMFVIRSIPTFVFKRLKL
jgi:decaprenylphospho-beta-D-erythro-pentofuranosid-2-ulose 2-reductase